MRTSEYLHPLLLYKTIICNAVDKIYLCKKHKNRTAKQPNRKNKIKNDEIPMENPAKWQKM